MVLNQDDRSACVAKLEVFDLQATDVSESMLKAGHRIILSAQRAGQKHQGPCSR